MDLISALKTFRLAAESYNDLTRLVRILNRIFSQYPASPHENRVSTGYAITDQFQDIRLTYGKPSAGGKPCICVGAIAKGGTEPQYVAWTQCSRSQQIVAAQGLPDLLRQMQDDALDMAALATTIRSEIRELIDPDALAEAEKLLDADDAASVK